MYEFEDRDSVPASDSIEPGLIYSEVNATWDENCCVVLMRVSFMYDESEIGEALVTILDPRQVHDGLGDAADCYSGECQVAYETLSSWLNTQNKREEPTAYIELIEIKPELRGRGVGKTCMEQVVQWLKRLRVRYVLLIAQPPSKNTEGWTNERVSQERERLVQFYTKLKFRVLEQDDKSWIMFARV
ncbi:GNAT family N-acetyltransferase [Alicyclobacillus sp. ALC3]|uniref:GNAT family N-acetyltransferase n=1 Tax=Alicyclobacillus sp. ALC3 TaxID=2796143 RepID=UPI002378510C|nr:GNAT family N-acetyltransferase [Alicyclobacillus sp. ALC3]WDL97948.1 GNAT family N-acetyltransferase [Alicyclobacillus sp. ALC3]